MESQPELGYALLEVRQHPSSILCILEAHYKVISKAHDRDSTPRHPLTPRMDTQIQHIMQKNVGEQWADHAPYTKGNVGCQLRKAAYCRLAMGAVLGPRCYDES